MGYERGLAAFNLEMTDKIPHTQFIENDSYIKKVTGIDTRNLKIDRLDYFLQKDMLLSKKLKYDFVWRVHEIPVQGRYTNMGHSDWTEVDGIDSKISCPFKTVDDVLDFDPLKEYSMPPVKAIAETFQKDLDRAKMINPDVLLSGGRYNTLFSGCIRAFGWEMFLSSVPGNEQRFDNILEGFLQISLTEIKAWAETDIKVCVIHDDIAWTAGIVFKPEWYKKYIMPKYKRLFAPLKEAGIKVLFTSDGNYTALTDDIAEAGADGFFIEPVMSLEYMVSRFGKSHVIVGNADCRILQNGTKEDIEIEVKRCIEIAGSCPGYFFCVSNLIANKISDENIDYLFECFEKMRTR